MTPDANTLAMSQLYGGEPTKSRSGHGKGAKLDRGTGASCSTFPGQVVRGRPDMSGRLITVDGVRRSREVRSPETR